MLGSITLDYGEPPTEKRHRRRYGRVAFNLGVLALEVAAVWQRTHRLGGNIVVRCGQGHLFTTIWIPAVSVKAVRLGWWRLQRCPVGKHWSLVTPVNTADLSAKELRLASEQRDIRIP